MEPYSLIFCHGLAAPIATCRKKLPCWCIPNHACMQCFSTVLSSLPPSCVQSTNGVPCLLVQWMNCVAVPAVLSVPPPPTTLQLLDLIKATNDASAQGINVMDELQVGGGGGRSAGKAPQQQQQQQQRQRQHESCVFLMLWDVSFRTVDMNPGLNATQQTPQGIELAVALLLHRVPGLSSNLLLANPTCYPHT